MDEKYVNKRHANVTMRPAHLCRQNNVMERRPSRQASWPLGRKADDKFESDATRWGRDANNETRMKRKTEKMNGDMRDMLRHTDDTLPHKPKTEEVRGMLRHMNDTIPQKSKNGEMWDMLRHTGDTIPHRLKNEDMWDMLRHMGETTPHNSRDGESREVLRHAIEKSPHKPKDGEVMEVLRHAIEKSPHKPMDVEIMEMLRHAIEKSPHKPKDGEIMDVLRHTDDTIPHKPKDGKLWGVFSSMDVELAHTPKDGDLWDSLRHTNDTAPQRPKAQSGVCEVHLRMCATDARAQQYRPQSPEVTSLGSSPANGMSTLMKRGVCTCSVPYNVSKSKTPPDKTVYYLKTSNDRSSREKVNYFKETDDVKTTDKKLCEDVKNFKALFEKGEGETKPHSCPNSDEPKASVRDRNTAVGKMVKKFSWKERKRSSFYKKIEELKRTIYSKRKANSFHGRPGNYDNYEFACSNSCDLPLSAYGLGSTEVLDSSPDLSLNRASSKKPLRMSLKRSEPSMSSLGSSRSELSAAQDEGEPALTGAEAVRQRWAHARSKNRQSFRKALFGRLLSCVGMGKAFQVDPDTHERILLDAQNTKATNVILNVSVFEASDLQHASGTPNPYCTLGLITARSPSTSPVTSRKGTSKSPGKRSEEQQVQQSAAAKNTSSPKWNESFELEVADMQVEDLQLRVYHQPGSPQDKSKSAVKGFFKRKSTDKNDPDFIGQCRVPLKGIPSVGHESWFTIYTDRAGKIESTGRVKLKLDFALKQESEQSHWAESDQCTVEEFHYVTKAMYRYSVLATAQSTKNTDDDVKPTFQGLPNQLRTILHQFAVQNQFSKLTQILVEAVVVMELCADKFCPCDIPEKLLRDSVVELELEYNSQTPLNEESAGEVPVLSNVERALFDKAGRQYIKYLMSKIKSADLPKLFPAEELHLDSLNKKISLAVSVLNMNTWQNSDQARKDASHVLTEEIQCDVREWVQEQLTYLDCNTGTDPDPVLPNMAAMTSIVNDSLLLLRPVYNVTQYFNRLGVDYFKVVSIEMERRLSAKSIELMLESDRYQMRYHRYQSNVRESSKLSLHFYFALRKLFAAVRNNVGDRDLYKTEIKDYQKWFENAAVFWLQTFREECIKRMEKALEIDKDVVQVTSQVKFSNSSVDVLSCFAIIAQEWNNIDFEDADIGLLGCTKVTYTICDGATQYAGRIQAILETNGYYDFIDNAQFDVTDQLCITLNNIMHVHQYLSKLAELLRFDSVCHNMSVKHEDERVGDKNRQMLENLVLSADREMLLRAHGMIQSITDKMAVDIHGFCKNFTRKDPKKKSSLDPLLTYLKENMAVLEEKLEHQLYPMILQQIWYTLLKAVQDTLLVGQHAEYYQHVLDHVMACKEYMFSEVKDDDDSQLFSTLMTHLHMQSLTSEQLLLLYYRDITQSKVVSTPVAYFGHLAVIVGYRQTGDSLDVHAKVCSAQNLPGLLKNNTCDPFVTVTLLPHTERGLKENRSTKVVESSLQPDYNQEFVFTKQSRDILSQEGACVMFSVWNNESLLPHDFLGELLVPLTDADDMSRVTSVDELTVRMLPLRRPEMPVDGPFKLLEERQSHEKSARWLVKQRSVMAGWQYSVPFGAPVFKVINQVKGKKTDLGSSSSYGLSSSTHGQDEKEKSEADKEGDDVSSNAPPPSSNHAGLHLQT